MRFKNKYHFLMLILFLIDFIIKLKITNMMAQYIILMFLFIEKLICEVFVSKNSQTSYRKINSTRHLFQFYLMLKSF